MECVLYMHSSDSHRKVAWISLMQPLLCPVVMSWGAGVIREQSRRTELFPPYFSVIGARLIWKSGDLSPTVPQHKERLDSIPLSAAPFRASSNSFTKMNKHPSDERYFKITETIFEWNVSDFEFFSLAYQLTEGAGLMTLCQPATRGRSWAVEYNIGNRCGVNKLSDHYMHYSNIINEHKLLETFDSAHKIFVFMIH